MAQSTSQQLSTVTSTLSTVLAVLIGIALLQALVVQPIATAAMTRAVGDIYLDRPASLGGAYRAVGQRLGSVVGVALLLLGFGVLLFVVAVGLVVGAVYAFGSGGAALAVLVGPVAIFLAILMYTRWLFAAPIVMLERAGAIAAMRRSWQLVRGSTPRVFGITLLVGLITGILGAIVGALLGVVSRIRRRERPPAPEPARGPRGRGADPADQLHRGRASLLRRAHPQRGLRHRDARGHHLMRRPRGWAAALLAGTAAAVLSTTASVQAATCPALDYQAGLATAAAALRQAPADLTGAVRQVSALVAADAGSAVALQPVLSDLSTTPPQVEDARSRLSSMSDTLAYPRGSVCEENAAAARSALHSVYASPDFRHLDDSTQPGLLQTILNAIAKLLSGGAAALGPVGAVVLASALVVICLLLAWRRWRGVRRRARCRGGRAGERWRRSRRRMARSPTGRQRRRPSRSDTARVPFRVARGRRARPRAHRRCLDDA